MEVRQADRALRPGALEEIERSLRGKLKAHGLSDPFIERSVEDAMQKGLVEYLRVLDRGEVVENPAGFIVQASFCRAIDELRQEARHADGVVIDALIESGGVPEPSTDEVAIDYLRVRELREAVSHLPPEEQQVLRLHYFDEMSAGASAKTLFCSDTTYRRRLDNAKKKLGELLGAPVPEPGSQLAIEIGVVLWVSLRGANVALAQGPIEQLVGIVHSAQDAAGQSWPGSGKAATITQPSPAAPITTRKQRSRRDLSASWWPRPYRRRNRVLPTPAPRPAARNRRRRPPRRRGPNSANRKPRKQSAASS